MIASAPRQPRAPTDTLLLASAVRYGVTALVVALSSCFAAPADAGDKPAPRRAPQTVSTAQAAPAKAAQTAAATQTTKSTSPATSALPRVVKPRAPASVVRGERELWAIEQVYYVAVEKLSRIEVGRSIITATREGVRVVLDRRHENVAVGPLNSGKGAYVDLRF